MCKNVLIKNHENSMKVEDKNVKTLRYDYFTLN